MRLYKRTKRAILAHMSWDPTYVNFNGRVHLTTEWVMGYSKRDIRAMHHGYWTGTSDIPLSKGGKFRTMYM